MNRPVPRLGWLWRAKSKAAATPIAPGETGPHGPPPADRPWTGRERRSIAATIVNTTLQAGRWRGLDR